MSVQIQRTNIPCGGGMRGCFKAIILRGVEGDICDLADREYATNGNLVGARLGDNVVLAGKENVGAFHMSMTYNKGREVPFSIGTLGQKLRRVIDEPVTAEEKQDLEAELLVARRLSYPELDGLSFEVVANASKNRGN